MKLRIRGNTLRLRLTRSEIDDLVSRGRVEDAIDFGAAGGKLVYALVADSAASDVRARFEGHTIFVHVPQRAARAWAASDDVGLGAAQAASDGELKILVEKDFACLKPREGEDDHDAFPHPRQGSESC